MRGVRVPARIGIQFNLKPERPAHVALQGGPVTLISTWYVLDFAARPPAHLARRASSRASVPISLAPPRRASRST